jgi:hypothetical protein
MQMAKAPGGSGWRVSGSLHTGAHRALIADHDGKTIGLVEPAPAVAVPNPSQMDVVRAVWRGLIARDEERERWYGLSQVGAGAPYRLIAIDDQGQPDCAIPVVVH